MLSLHNFRQFTYLAHFIHDIFTFSRNGISKVKLHLYVEYEYFVHHPDCSDWLADQTPLNKEGCCLSF